MKKLIDFNTFGRKLNEDIFNKNKSLFSDEMIGENILESLINISEENIQSYKSHTKTGLSMYNSVWYDFEVDMKEYQILESRVTKKPPYSSAETKSEYTLFSKSGSEKEKLNISPELAKRIFDRVKNICKNKQPSYIF